MINAARPVLQESAAALGLFDGVHLGHRKVLSAAVHCRADGLRPCVFTFNTETFPKKHGREFEYLYTQAHKEHLFEAIGIEEVYAGSFSDIGEMDGESFCRYILRERLNVRKVFCGGDFRFGRDAAWGFSELLKFGQQLGFEAICIEPVCIGGAEVSSTRIREYLRSGDPEKASELLGSCYEIYGEVIYGKALGRTISFPTINQSFQKGQLVPANGVYLSEVITPDGISHIGVTNIGIKPTVSTENIPLAETHILDFCGDLYGKRCRTRLRRFLRSEKKFENITALQRAIITDTENARRLAESI